MDRKKYEKELRERQEQHLESIDNFNSQFWKPCLHDQCAQCNGTGIKADGSFCTHWISCDCPKCRAY